MLELQRRDFLKKIGAASLSSLALGPLVLASRAYAETATKPRIVLIRLSHGVGGGGMATGTEYNFTLSPWLTPLNAIKEHITLVDGVFGTWWGNAHNVSMAHMLTGSVKPNGPGFPTSRSASLDILLEEHLGRGILPVQRLQVSHSGTGENSTKTICWNKYNQPMPFSGTIGINKNLLNNIGINQKQTTNYLDFRRKTLLDEAVKDLKRLKGRINTAEQQKLEYQLTAISDASASLGLGKKAELGGSCQKPNVFGKSQHNKLKAGNRGKAFDAHFGQQLEHIRLMFACNLTQIAVVDIGQVNDKAFTWVDLKGNTRHGKPCPDSDFHQCVAHHSGDPEARLCYEGSIRYVMQKLVGFAQQLDKIVEPNGKTMLENTMIVVNGEVGNGTHDRTRKPVVIIGGRGAPGIRTGRYISVPTQRGFLAKNTIDGEVKIGKTISSRTEADLMRELGFAMGYKTKTFGSPYLNRGTIGLF